MNGAADRGRCGARSCQLLAAVGIRRRQQHRPAASTRPTAARRGRKARPGHGSTARPAWPSPSSPNSPTGAFTARADGQRPHIYRIRAMAAASGRRTADVADARLFAAGDEVDARWAAVRCVGSRRGVPGSVLPRRPLVFTFRPTAARPGDKPLLIDDEPGQQPSIRRSRLPRPRYPDRLLIVVRVAGGRFQPPG